jgi:hypothetical protein
MDEMKAYLVFSARGPVLVLASYDFAKHPESLDKLAAKTSGKFIAHEVPLDAVKSSYSAHFAHVLEDPSQAGDVKILDDDGTEILTNVRFKGLSAPIYYDPD